MSVMTNVNLLSLVLGPSDYWPLSTVSLGFSEMSAASASGAVTEELGTDT